MAPSALGSGQRPIAESLMSCRWCAGASEGRADERTSSLALCSRHQPPRAAGPSEDGPNSAQPTPQDRTMTALTRPSPRRRTER